MGRNRLSSWEGLLFSLRADLLNVLMKTELVYKFGIYFQNMSVNTSYCCCFCSVMSDSLWPHGLQHTRLSCPSPSPRGCWNACPLSWWCHPTISSSVIPFSSCPQSFPASGSFPMSLLLASDGQKCCSFSLSISPFNEQELTVIGFRTIRKLTMRTGKFRPPPAVRGLHLHPRQVSSSHTPGGKQRAAWPGEHWECSPSGPRERDWTAHLDPHDTEAWEVCSEPQ